MDHEEYVETYRDTQGQYRWRLKAVENDKALANGGQGYSNEPEMIAAIARTTHREPVKVESKSAAVGADSIRLVRVDG